jgi:RNase P/RNase MRP subunit p29
MNIYNSTWIGEQLTVVASPDTSLLGRIGVVLDESRETITILEESNEISLGKQSIDFKIGNSDVVINGARVGQRPEDRINKKYRMA